MRLRMKVPRRLFLSAGQAGSTNQKKSELSEEGDMLLLFFWFLGGRAVDRFAEAAPRFAAALAEAAIRAGILFHDRFLLHLFSIAR